MTNGRRLGAESADPPPRVGRELGGSFGSTLRSAWLGVVLAGPVFGVVWGTLMLVVHLNVTSDDFFLALILFAIAGVVLATTSSICAFGAMLLFNWSMEGIFSRQIGVLVFGGLSGFAAAEPFLTGLQGGLLGRNWFVEHPQVGIAAAMLFGQLGAHWRYGCRIHTNVDSAQSEGDPIRFQFKTSQLLVLMIWIGLLLGLDQAWEGHRLVRSVSYFVVVQTGLLLAIGWLTSMYSKLIGPASKPFHCIEQPHE